MHYKTGIPYVIYIGYCAEASAPTDIFQTDCERRGVHETGRMAVPADPAGDQILKLMTLGLTEQEAEEKILDGFLQ